MTKSERGEITAPSALEQANFSRRSFLEKQLALNLTQFGNVDKDLNLGRDQLENLLGMLIVSSPRPHDLMAVPSDSHDVSAILLTHTVLSSQAEAPVEVVKDMMAAEDAEHVRSAVSAIPPSPPSSEQPDLLSSQQRRELQILQELIRRRLENCK